MWVEPPGQPVWSTHVGDAPTTGACTIDGTNPGPTMTIQCNFVVASASPVSFQPDEYVLTTTTASASGTVARDGSWQVSAGDFNDPLSASGSVGPAANGATTITMTRFSFINGSVDTQSSP